MSMNTSNMSKKEVPLKEYIKGYISVSVYFSCIIQIVNMLEKLQGEGIQLVLDIRQMKVIDQQIHFQLITEESVYESERIKSFLKEFTFECLFDGMENCEKISEFLRFLYVSWNGRNYYDIKKFVNEDTTPVASSFENRMSQPVIAHSALLSGGETGVLDVTYWEELEQKYSGPNNNGETGVLDPSFWDKALSNTPSQRLASSARAVVVPKLVHKISGKVVPITKSSFWIGKEDVDLLIDKDVISRKHAQLITRDNHYFLIDNNSTNKTYVEGKAIPPKASVEIYDGTKIKFVDEEYIFCID